MTKDKKMEKIKDELVALKESPLYEYRVSNDYVPVVGEGNTDADIVFIGEAPGKNEAQTGRPFCGASGKVLDGLLAHIKLDREDVYITNIVKDRPQDNRDPSKEEIALYTPFLLRQIEIIQPKVIATLGRYSMEYIMEQFGLSDEVLPISQGRGRLFKTEQSWGDMYILPLYHPAVAIYNRKQLPVLEKDFELLKRFKNKKK